jgi:DNA (cytosine-5)-methyltransferase 1
VRTESTGLTFGSFCSGIGAPDLAWSRLGWRPLFFSEIDPFACAVLAHRYPGVPNLGDMEKISEKTLGAFRPDVVVAGTPCQSFSVAGLRKGMDDPRGNLALVFLRLVDQLRPRWVVWENVDGVRSSGDGRDFGSFLGALGQLGYGWAYRVLDAQYGGVPQRRRRVFVVGHLGDWRRAAAVLLERQSLSGNPPPCREAGSRVAGTLAARPSGGGGLGTEFETDGGLIVRQTAATNFGVRDTSTCLTTKGQRLDPDTETFVIRERLGVAHTLRAEGFDASEDGTGRGIPLVPCAIQEDNQNGITVRDTAGSLRADAPGTQPCGTLVGVPICYREDRGRGNDNAIEGQTYPLHAASHANAGGQVAVAFQERGREGGRNVEAQTDLANSLNAPNGGGRRQEMNVVTPAMAVRRLTPLECERLMSFPDGYTAIEFRGKPAADGNRYRALGNSMVCVELEWIGRRIMEVEAVPEEKMTNGTDSPRVPGGDSLQCGAGRPDVATAGTALTNKATSAEEVTHVG